jgi:O-antigen/teichoic acid export membrane protein
MTLASKIVSGSLLTVGANGASYACSFIRNMILARVLSKADFGAAATLWMILGLLELTAKMGIGRFVVQDPEGDRPAFVATMHALQALIGAASSLIILVATPFAVKLFDLPGPTWIVMLLGVIPLLRGFQHLGVRGFERHLRFGPSTMVEVLPQAIITLLAYPIAMWLPDFRAVLVLTIIQAALGCLLSHILVNHPYRWAWQREFVARMLRFGWPLVLTGFLMFGVFQGDQLIVASFYTLSDLGPYAAASTLAMVPGMLFGGAVNSVGLPILSQVQSDVDTFKKRYLHMMELVVLFSVSSAVCMILGCELLMVLVYGHKYSGSGLLLAWLAAAHAFRNLRMAPALAALARGDSQNSLISNIARVMGLAPALAAALAGWPIWAVAASGLFGEALACWVSFRRLEKRDKIPISESLQLVTVLAIIVGASGFFWWAVVQGLSFPLAALVTISGTVIAGALVILRSKELRRGALYLWWAFSNGGWHGLWECLKEGKLSE